MSLMAPEYKSLFINKYQATLIEYDGQTRQVLGPCWIVYGLDELGPVCYNPFMFYRNFFPQTADAFRMWAKAYEEVDLTSWWSNEYNVE